MSEYHDVAVLGLGTAGLSACKVLDENGIDYIGVDSKKQIGVPIRSTGGVADLFVQRYGMPNDDSVIVKRIKAVRIVSESGESVSLTYDHPVGVIYDFTMYENAILRYRNHIRMNTRIRKAYRLESGNREYCLDLEDDPGYDQQIFSKYLINATGPVSNIRVNDPDYALPDKDVIAAYEETRYIKNPSDYDVVLYFNSKYAPGGYLWDFADRDGKRRIGLGAVKSANQNLRANLAAFSEENPLLKGEVDHTIGHLIAVSPPPKRVVFGNEMIVGEAARTTFASTGGGLQMAYGSGSEAALAVVNRNPLQYQRIWSRDVRPVLKRHYKVKELLYSLSPEELNRVVVSVQGFHPKSENAYKEIPRVIGFVTRKLPWLIPRAMKVVL